MSRERRLSANGLSPSPATQSAPGVLPVSPSKRPMLSVMDRRFPATQGTPGVFPVSPSKCPMLSVMDRLPLPTQRIRALPGGAPGQRLKTPNGVVMGRRFPATQGTPGVFPVGPSKCPMVWVMDRQTSPSLRIRTLEMIYANAYNQKNVAVRAVSPSNALVCCHGHSHSISQAYRLGAGVEQASGCSVVRFLDPLGRAASARGHAFASARQPTPVSALRVRGMACATE